MSNSGNFIPPEVFVSSIFKHLCYEDLCNVKLTCKKWSNCVDAYYNLEKIRGMYIHISNLKTHLAKSGEFNFHSTSNIIPVKDAISSSIIISGGFEDKNFCYKRDPPSKSVILFGNKYRSLVPLPEEIDAHCMTVANNNELLVAGGYTYAYTRKTYKPSRICYVYKRNSWFLLSTLNEMRIYSSMITMPNGVYIFGGAKHPLPKELTPENASHDTSEFLPNGSGEWQLGPKIPLHGLYGASGVAISNDEILLSGGRHFSNRILIFKISTNSWYITNLINGRWTHASFVYKDNVIISGGWSETGNTVFGSTEILSLSDGSIKIGGNLNVPRRGHGMGIIDFEGTPKLVAFGGRNDKRECVSSIEEWNETDQRWEMSKLTLPGPKYWAAFAFCSSPNQFLRHSVTSQWQNLIPL